LEVADGQQQVRFSVEKVLSQSIRVDTSKHNWRSYLQLPAPRFRKEQINTMSDTEEKAIKPCKNYRLDTEGEKFGDCKCGWSKSSHKRKSINKAGKALDELRNNNQHESDDEFEEEEKAAKPCKNYRLNTEAAIFGECKCGWEKSAHIKSQKSKLHGAAQRLHKSSNVDGMMFDEACDKFRLDTTAAEFGVCKCGYKRPAHDAKGSNVAADALSNLRKKNEQKHKDEDDRAAGKKTTEQVADRDTAAQRMKEMKARKKAEDAKANPQPAEAAPAIANESSSQGGCCVVC
jgi:hypothetical protein